MNTEPQTITLALTGASGMPYGLRLLEQLLKHDKQVYLLASSAAHVVLKQETDLSVPGNPDKARDYLCDYFDADPAKLTVYGQQEWNAGIASGSSVADAMVVCPCTSGALAAIANGNSDNLLERAADVSLKEQKPLIIVHREMPLSAIHLENMLRLSRAGALIMPANPGFYHEPKSINDLVDFVVARILDRLNIVNELSQRWA